MNRANRQVPGRWDSYFLSAETPIIKLSNMGRDIK